MHVCMCTCVFLYVQMYVCVQMEAVGHTWVYLGTNALIFLKKTCFYLYVCMHLFIYLFVKWDDIEMWRSKTEYSACTTNYIHVFKHTG